MNKRPYEIKDEEYYNHLVKKANRLSKIYKIYCTVIWSKEYNRWWMTFMFRRKVGLVDKM